MQILKRNIHPASLGVTYLLWMPSHSMCCLWATSGCFLTKSTSVGNRNSQPRLTRGAATCSRNSFTSSGGSWRRTEEELVSSVYLDEGNICSLEVKTGWVFKDAMQDCGGSELVPWERVCFLLHWHKELPLAVAMKKNVLLQSQQLMQKWSHHHFILRSLQLPNQKNMLVIKTNYFIPDSIKKQVK